MKCTNVRSLIPSSYETFTVYVKNSSNGIGISFHQIDGKLVIQDFDNTFLQRYENENILTTNSPMNIKSPTYLHINDILLSINSHDIKNDCTLAKLYSFLQFQEPLPKYLNERSCVRLETLNNIICMRFARSPCLVDINSLNIVIDTPIVQEDDPPLENIQVQSPKLKIKKIKSSK